MNIVEDYVAAARQAMNEHPEVKYSHNYLDYDFTGKLTGACVHGFAYLAKQPELVELKSRGNYAGLGMWDKINRLYPGIDNYELPLPSVWPKTSLFNGVNVLNTQTSMTAEQVMDYVLLNAQERQAKADGETPQRNWVEYGLGVLDAVSGSARPVVEQVDESTTRWTWTFNANITWDAVANEYAAATASNPDDIRWAIDRLDTAISPQPQAPAEPVRAEPVIEWPAPSHYGQPIHMWRIDLGPMADGGYSRELVRHMSRPVLAVDHAREVPTVPRLYLDSPPILMPRVTPLSIVVT